VPQVKCKQMIDPDKHFREALSPRSCQVHKLLSSIPSADEKAMIKPTEIWIALHRFLMSLLTGFTS